MKITQEIILYSTPPRQKEHNALSLEKGLYYSENHFHLRLLVVSKGGPFIMFNNFNEQNKPVYMMALEKTDETLRFEHWLPAKGERIVIEG